MKYDAEVINCMRCYPTLWMETGEFGIAHHLFCVLGNGYEWHKFTGQLIDRSADDRKPIMSTDTAAKILHMSSKSYPPELYPISDMAKICTVPRNIDKSWYTGICQFIRRIMNIDPKVYKQFLISRAKLRWPKITPAYNDIRQYIKFLTEWQDYFRSNKCIGGR